MGFDVGLAVLVLLNGLRGWFRGFLLQLIQVAGLIAAAYVAEPVRESVKPHVQPYFPAIAPELLDKFLWWLSAIVSYLVMVGFAHAMVNLYKRGPLRELEPNRTDQFAGFAVGVLKGALIGSAVLTLFDQNATHLTKIAWVDEQVKTSQALQLNREHEPAMVLWRSQPVQNFIAHVKTMGVVGPSESSGSKTAQAEAEPNASESDFGRERSVDPDAKLASTQKDDAERSTRVEKRGKAGSSRTEAPDRQAAREKAEIEARSTLEEIEQTVQAIRNTFSPRSSSGSDPR